MPAAHVPSIDLGPFMEHAGVVIGEDPTPEQLRVAQEINESCRHNGFMTLTNFGLTEHMLDTYFSAVRALFQQPDEYKLSHLERIEENHGYIPVGEERLNSGRGADLKEAYNIVCRRRYDSAFSGCPPGFKDASSAFWDTIEAASARLTVAIALALGIPSDYFLEKHSKCDSTTMRLLHYPPTTFDAGVSTGDDSISALRVGEHTDFGMFTFLFVDGPGLQVKAIEGGERHDWTGGESGDWLDVPVPEGASAIVNTGALMARWTNDIWRATAHRVVVSNVAQACKDRYAIAWFWDPDKDALIEVHPKFVAPGQKAKYEPITSHEYVQRKLSEARGLAI